MPRSLTPTPLPVRRALTNIGQNLADWRRIQRLTLEQAADRAGVSSATLQRIEKGRDANFENILRVARVLGTLDRVIAAFDPQQTDIGRVRALETLPKRVRPKQELF